MKNFFYSPQLIPFTIGLLIGIIGSSIAWASITIANSTSGKIISDTKELSTINPMSEPSELARLGFTDSSDSRPGVTVMYGKEIRYGWGLAITPVLIRPKTGNQGLLLYNIDTHWAGL